MGFRILLQAPGGSVFALLQIIARVHEESAIEQMMMQSCPRDEPHPELSLNLSLFR
jgi:hypothetical protein